MLNAARIRGWATPITIASFGHIVPNARPFKRHLATRRGKTGLAVIAALLLAFFFSWGLVTGPRRKRPVELALVDAPLSALASTTRTLTEILIARLNAQGMTYSPAPSRSSKNAYWNAVSSSCA